jgi:hypothetical protein
VSHQPVSWSFIGPFGGRMQYSVCQPSSLCSPPFLRESLLRACRRCVHGPGFKGSPDACVGDQLTPTFVSAPSGCKYDVSALPFQPTGMSLAQHVSCRCFVPFLPNREEVVLFECPGNRMPPLPIKVVITSVDLGPYTYVAVCVYPFPLVFQTRLNRATQ